MTKPFKDRKVLATVKMNDSNSIEMKSYDLSFLLFDIQQEIKENKTIHMWQSKEGEFEVYSSKREEES